LIVCLLVTVLVIKKLIVSASDGQFNSQFDFCGGADESVCAGPLINNSKPHAKVSFHKK
jgi:hypothetical protein